jgi:hypothetical protein
MNTLSKASLWAASCFVVVLFSVSVHAQSIAGRYKIWNDLTLQHSGEKAVEDCLAHLIEQNPGLTLLLLDSNFSWEQIAPTGFVVNDLPQTIVFYDKNNEASDTLSYTLKETKQDQFDLTLSNGESFIFQNLKDHQILKWRNLQIYLTKQDE